MYKRQLTVLCQDSTGGLQVQDINGDWIHAPPIEGTLIVNVADLLARWLSDGLRQLSWWSSFFGRDRFFVIVVVSVIVRSTFDGWILVPNLRSASPSLAAPKNEDATEMLFEVVVVILLIILVALQVVLLASIVTIINCLLEIYHITLYTLHDQQQRQW